MNSKSNQKVIIKCAHIQITDHLILGVLKHFIDSGHYTPKYFDVQCECMISWNPVGNALEEGTIDAGFVQAPVAIDLFSINVPIKILLLTHKNGSIAVRTYNANEPGIDPQTLVHYLTNKCLYIPHMLSVQHMLAFKYFQEIGLSPGLSDNPDANLFFEVLPPVLMPQFLVDNDEVGGFSVAEPIGSLAIQQGKAERIFYSGEIWNNHPCCVLAMRDEMINTYPDAVQEFINMLVMAGRFITDNLEESSKIAVSFLDPQNNLGLTEKLIRQVLSQPSGITTDDLMPNLEDIDYLQKYMHKTMGFGSIVDLEKLVDLRFAQNIC